MADMINPAILNFLYLRWTILHDIPFVQVQSHEFRTFLEYINPAANRLLPNSHSTIRNHAIKLFEEGKRRIRHILQTAVSSIHITCDLWTSPNHLGLIGVTSHFTGEDTKLHTLTLGLREIQGAHSGKNQAIIVNDIIEDFQINDRLGYFILDNASSNNTMVKEVAKKFRDRGIQFNPLQRRLRCCGHIINLTVQAFLFGKISDNLNYLEEFQEDQEIHIPTDNELNHWRQIGPLGKLHNIIAYICLSPQRKQRFKLLSSDLLPHRDNKTRWNSWDNILDWAIKRLKPAITQFCAEEDDLRDNHLTSLDWKNLQAIRDFLQGFYDTTKALKGRAATLEHFLPSLEFLIQQFEKGLEKYAGHRFLIGCLDAGHTKIIKYFNKADRSAVYLAAVILNPSVK